MNAQNVPPIIIIKKKVNHAGHHGGAWKVAYADFVTAMMALFIVLWLMTASVKIRKAISAYFRDPSGTGNLSGSARAGTGEGLSVSKDNMANLKENLEQALKRSPEFEKLKNYVQMSVTGEGLRIEMLESEKGIFFASASPDPTTDGQDLLDQLAKQLGKLPNDIVIEGHTDARRFSGGRAGYSNWELSTDRANTARHIMEDNGLRPDQIVQVRGFADQDPRDKDHPDAASNRRISVIVRYQDADPNATDDPNGPPGGTGPPSGKAGAAKEPGASKESAAAVKEPTTAAKEPAAAHK
jgi:chemotaxis protein MotB